jgi:glutamate/tyrosine decarboxylase-like PLP-dependent enzyme
MNPTPTYMGVLGEALVAALNPQLATLARSQLASKIELETVRWIGERVGWPGESSGTFTSGGNEANFTGMALALASKFPDSVEDGLGRLGIQPVAYASAEAHHSLDKSAGLLGFGRKGLRRIPVRASIQMDTAKLEQAIEDDIAAGMKPFCVIATAGTTNTGTIDDLEAIASVARNHDVWLHVDGAYGGAAIFSDAHRSLVSGIELADSITIDPHKWLAMPFAAGVALTRHPEALEQAFAVAAPYMPKATGATLPDNSRISTQWSRRMNSLKLWLTLKVHGRLAYEQLIDGQLSMAKEFAAWVEESSVFELAAPQVLPIVAFRIKRQGASGEQVMNIHNRIVDDVTRDGQMWISETKVNGQSALRMMVISYLTQSSHLSTLQDRLMKAAQATGKTA